VHDDDAPAGRVLSRREALAALGAAGVAVLGGGLTVPGPHAAEAARVPQCVVRPEQTEGPYFVDAKLERSDIRSDPSTGKLSEGVGLDLGFRVMRVGGGECRPLPGALVDVWQCDALGVYSDVRDTNARFDTVGQKFLRGRQVSDADGTVRFVTIYPGWYQGRTVHIHFKIRTAAESGRAREFTSQLYFDDAITDAVLRRAPYATKGPAQVRNAQDGIYRRGGDQLVLVLSPKDDGYAGTFEVGLQLP